MKLHWTSTENTSHLHWSPERGKTVHVGYIDYLYGGGYQACDMSGMKWVWRNFDDLEDAKAWLLVCVRMNHAS